MPKKSGWVGTALLWIAALSWAWVMFFFSGQNANESGRLSLWLTQHVMRIFPSLPFAEYEVHYFVRKAAHFSIFAVEGFLLGLAMMKTLPDKRMGGVLAAIACVVVAVLNEYHQTFAEGRSCELRDMLIDSAGALLGVFAGALLLQIIEGAFRRRRNVIIS